MVASLAGDRFAARPLAADDGADLERLVRACADYFEVVYGRPPGPAEAQSIFLAGPEEGADPNNKMLYGIRRPNGDALIGVLDGFADYPQPGTWYIGLLMFEPAARKDGIGADVVDAFAAAAAGRGARELQINVVEQNQAALRFWQRCGFIEMRRWRQHYGARESTFIRLRRAL